MDRGGDVHPEEVSNSKTIDSKVVDTTVNTELAVKHAKNRPLGAKAMDTIGALFDPPIFVRQSTSVKPLLGLVEGCNSETTTDPSDVDKNNSGRREGANCRGRTAMHPYEKCFDLANMAVGNGVTKA
jgi:hypothetical protein